MRCASSFFCGPRLYGLGCLGGRAMAWFLLFNLVKCAADFLLDQACKIFNAHGAEIALSVFAH
jgi:hypothetical protein